MRGRGKIGPKRRKRDRKRSVNSQVAGQVRALPPPTRVWDGTTHAAPRMAASEAAGALSMQSLSSSVPQAGEGLPGAVQPPAGAPSAEASDLAFGPSDEYNYAQHLMPIGEGKFIQRAGAVRSTADDAASRAEMDDDLWAALHDDGEAGEEGEEAQEEAFIEDLLEVQR